MTMTPRQIELARHALGLPNASKVSYRNRFFAKAGHRDYADWQAMEAMSCAEQENGHFWLTQKGADAALLPGEALDPEDFPVRHPACLRRGMSSWRSP